MRDFFSNHSRALSVMVRCSALLLLLLPGISGCEPRSEPNSRRHAGETDVQNEPTPESPAEIAAQDEEPESVVPEVVERSVARFLLAGGALQRITPRDAQIGELPDAAADSGARAAVRRRIEGFFAGLPELQSGAAEHVIDSERERLVRMLSDDLSDRQSMLQLRLGRIQWVDASEAIAVVRLLDDTGRTSGDIVLERRNADWYIADILLDLGALRDPRTASGARVEPWFDRSPLIGP